MNNQRVQLQQVQQLLADDHPDAAAEILASVAHPMTAIWLDHLKAGGRDRLLLQESLMLHADDPRIAEVQALIERNDLDGATAILSAMNHPMTAIWLDHLKAGGRERLMMPAADRRTAPSAETSTQTNSDPMPASPPILDARMRRILELQQSPQIVDSPRTSPPPIYRTDPILTLTPPKRNGWRAASDHWARLKGWHKLGVVFVLSFAVIFVMAAPPPLGPFGLIGLIMVAGMVRLSTVMISIQSGPQGELIWEERASFRGTEIWCFRLNHDTPLLYAGPPVQGFQSPPAALALNIVVPDGQAVGHPDAVQAYTIAKMALLALWATGRIRIYYQHATLTLLGLHFKGRQRYIMRPHGMTSAGATVEDRVWAALAITPTVGRNIPDLARAVLSNPRQLVQIAENEAINSGTAKRGMVRRRIHFDPRNTLVTNETQQLLTLHANVMLYHAPIYRLISDALARVVRVLPVHTYAIGR